MSSRLPAGERRSQRRRVLIKRLKRAVRDGQVVGPGVAHLMTRGALARLGRAHIRAGGGVRERVVERGRGGQRRRHRGVERPVGGGEHPERLLRAREARPSRGEQRHVGLVLVLGAHLVEAGADSAGEARVRELVVRFGGVARAGGRRKETLLRHDRQVGARGGERELAPHVGGRLFGALPIVLGVPGLGPGVRGQERHRQGEVGGELVHARDHVAVQHPIAVEAGIGGVAGQARQPTGARLLDQRVGAANLVERDGRRRVVGERAAHRLVEGDRGRRGEGRRRASANSDAMEKRRRARHRWAGGSSTGCTRAPSATLSPSGDRHRLARLDAAFDPHQLAVVAGEHHRPIVDVRARVDHRDERLLTAQHQRRGRHLDPHRRVHRPSSPRRSCRGRSRRPGCRSRSR